MAITDSMKEKAGPLPVYGWVLVIGVSLIGLMYYRSKKNAATSSANTPTPDNTTSTGPTAEDLTAGEIGADYSLANQLALTQSATANLATNVGKNTIAQSANTVAVQQDVKADTPVKATKPVHGRKPPIHHKPPPHKRKPPARPRPKDDD